MAPYTCTYCNGSGYQTCKHNCPGCDAKKCTDCWGSGQRVCKICNGRGKRNS